VLDFGADDDGSPDPFLDVCWVCKDCAHANFQEVATLIKILKNGTLICGLSADQPSLCVEADFEMPSLRLRTISFHRILPCIAPSESRS
jgi:hypothetical protein